MFWSSIFFKVGTKSKIAFWRERWCSMNTLYSLYPLIFEMNRNKDAMMEDCWWRGRWNLALTGNTGVGWNAAFNDFKSLLDGLVLGNTPEDIPIWRWESTGIFIVISMYRHLIDGSTRLCNGKLVWKSKCSLRVRFFMWLVINDTILTWANLHKRRWMDPSWCALCKRDSDDGQYLFA